MNFTRTAVLAVVLVASIATSAGAESVTRTIEYHPDASPTIYCAAGLECEIRLASGERITRAENPQAQLWSPDAGVTNGRVVLMLKPEAPGFRANYIVLTDKREYRMWLVSYDGTKHMRPLYTQFAYDDEARLKARQRARELALAPRPPPPLTVAQQMDAACAKMPADEQYGTDLDPIVDKHPMNLRPIGLPSRGGRSVCHTLDSTFIQMPLGGPNPTDVPSLVEEAPDGVRVVNYTYEPTSRIFRVDDVATDYALVSGKVRLRIQRQIGGNAAACATPKGKR
jgi:hypothetical protein